MTNINIEFKFFAVSIIIAIAVYSGTLYYYDMHTANSLLIGYAAAFFDLYALSRLLRKLITNGAGWLYAPLAYLRLAIVGVIIAVGLVYYKANFVALAIGVVIPVVSIFIGLALGFLKSEQTEQKKIQN